jgi:fumarate hydratase, class I
MLGVRRANLCRCHELYADAAAWDQGFAASLQYGDCGGHWSAERGLPQLPIVGVEPALNGPAGHTKATRVDGFTEMMLAQTGLISMIGKAERGPAGIEAIKKHKSAYLMAVCGAAYLVSKAIKTAKVIGFADLGMEAIYEFDVVDTPVTVAVDSSGTSAHITGPAEWHKRIATGEFKGIGVSAG